MPLIPPEMWSLIHHHDLSQIFTPLFVHQHLIISKTRNCKDDNHLPWPSLTCRIFYCNLFIRVIKVLDMICFTNEVLLQQWSIYINKSYLWFKQSNSCRIWRGDIQRITIWNAVNPFITAMCMGCHRTNLVHSTFQMFFQNVLCFTWVWQGNGWHSPNSTLGILKKIQLLKIYKQYDSNIFWYGDNILYFSMIHWVTIWFGSSAQYW